MKDATAIRKAMIEGGVDYVCGVCGHKPFWNGKPLRLRLVRVANMLPLDRIDNFKFMDPICYSQVQIHRARGGKVDAQR